MRFDTLQLISFYKTFGFVPIPGDQLPKDDPGAVPVLLWRDGRVQRLPDAESGGEINWLKLSAIMIFFYFIQEKRQKIYVYA